MKAEFIQAFQVVTNTDLTEGRGRSISAGTYFTRDEAIAAASGAGVMGTPADVRPVKAIRLDDGSGFVIEERITSAARELEKVKERALAKLSPLERKLLGL